MVTRQAHYMHKPTISLHNNDVQSFISKCSSVDPNVHARSIVVVDPRIRQVVALLIGSAKVFPVCVK